MAMAMSRRPPRASSTGWLRSIVHPVYRLRYSASAIAVSRPTALLRKPSLRRPRRRVGPNSCRSTPWTASLLRTLRVGATPSGKYVGLELVLAHQAAAPATEVLTLTSRRDYGAEVQAPTAILRFAAPRTTLWQRLTGRGFANFRAGDLIGIVPEGSSVPRLYSLASASSDGFVEIVVKRHQGGLCSGQLTALEPGCKVAAFLRRNPRFQPGRGCKPLILIGAGTGIGPLAGFVRDNARRRPIHLFFGMRDPSSDFFYGEEIEGWQKEGRLSRLVIAVSRGARPHYVQDALRNEAASIAGLVLDGARVMVCGGRDMAAGVAAALTDILAPPGCVPAFDSSYCYI